MVDLGRWLNEDYVISVPREPLALGPESGAENGNGDGSGGRDVREH